MHVQANDRTPAHTPTAAQLRIGHVSGRLVIDAKVLHGKAGWEMKRANLSRRARVIMPGWVHFL